MLNALEELRKIRATAAAQPPTFSQPPEPKAPEAVSPRGCTAEDRTTDADTTAAACTFDDEATFDIAASAALRIVALSETPLPHPQIVRALAGKGYSKPEAYTAIAHCQGRGWIAHNLTTGYILTV